MLREREREKYKNICQIYYKATKYQEKLGQKYQTYSLGTISSPWNPVIQPTGHGPTLCTTCSMQSWSSTLQVLHTVQEIGLRHVLHAVPMLDWP